MSIALLYRKPVHPDPFAGPILLRLILSAYKVRIVTCCVQVDKMRAKRLLRLVYALQREPLLTPAIEPATARVSKQGAPVKGGKKQSSDPRDSRQL